MPESSISEFPPAPKLASRTSWGKAAWAAVVVAALLGMWGGVRFLYPNTSFDPPAVVAVGRPESLIWDLPDCRGGSWVVKVKRAVQDIPPTWLALDTLCLQGGRGICL